MQLTISEEPVRRPRGAGTEVVMLAAAILVAPIAFVLGLVIYIVRRPFSR